MLPFNLGVGGGAIDIGDNVPNSLMLDSTASQYLSRTFGTPTNQSIYTLSVWAKRAKLSVLQNLFGVSTNHSLGFTAADTFVLTLAGVAQATSSALLRDPSGDMHLLYVQNGTAISLYLNGTLIATGTATSAVFNTAVAHQIGAANTAAFADCYLSNAIFVDGQALTPADFGRTSVDTGAWVNKTYTGTYGANGFKLEFLNGASLGTDTSGNGNNWTLNGGITSANQTTDTPTNNYCVMNSLFGSSGFGTITKGSLRVSGATGTVNSSRMGSLAIKDNTYFTASVVAVGTIGGYGICPTSANLSYLVPSTMPLGAFYLMTGQKRLNGVNSAYGAAFTTADIISVAVDPATQTIEFFKNNVSQGVISLTGYFTQDMVPYGGFDDTGNPVTQWCFGSTAFPYTPPTGFKALCTANLPQPSNLKPSANVAHRWEAGSGIAANIATDRTSWTDWIEIFKRTDSAEDWKLRFSSDTGNMLSCNTNAAKTAWVAPSAGTYLGLALKVGVAYGIATGTYAGNSAASQDVAHGLGVAAKFALIKDEATGSVYVWHTSMTGATYFTIMDSASPPAQSLTNTPFGGSGWTSTTFGVTNNATNNLNATGHTYRYILFASVEGFLQALGHTGNASTDGTFEYAGGRPQVQISKNLAVATDFLLFSDMIDPYNVTASTLSMNTTAAKAAATGVDIVSNGIKHRSTTVANAANAYMDVSILRNSIKYSNAR